MKKLLVFGVIGFTGALVSINALGFTWNKTASYPQGIYKITKVEDPQTIEKGSLVIACPENNEIQQTAKERGYLQWGVKCNGFAPIIKKVAAVEGDNVIVTNKGVSVNGELIENTARLDSDTKKRELPLATSGVVQSGEVWLLSDHAPRSWDSRYWGAVDVNTIFGTVEEVYVKE